jgi:4-aminobutyrate aminotransferase-like enzyme
VLNPPLTVSVAKMERALEIIEEAIAQTQAAFRSLLSGGR